MAVHQGVAVASQDQIPIRALGRRAGRAWALRVLWELPQTLLGLGLWLLLRATGRVLQTASYGRRLLVHTRAIGVSLGFFVFWFGPISAPSGDSPILRHELGHALQSMWLGPAYLPVVGIPSALRAAYAIVYAQRHGRQWPAYARGYPEKWADRLGGVTDA